MLRLMFQLTKFKLTFLLNSTGNNFNEKREQIDTKSNQWFGMTVTSAGIDGPLVLKVWSVLAFIFNVTLGSSKGAAKDSQLWSMMTLNFIHFLCYLIH
ncbi:CLUMA_CG014988, isoform A [Clunio marinus]|uniref:CLUMA_CG014988, isoform A n=1 Tax=Clunio marinus TaxID=568069 RepID=A0A1J1IQF2_9DIPT|nr:CLUMA_CG014988, isoform A [Clunio marinus]